MSTTITSKELSVRVPLYHPDMPFAVFWSEKSGCTITVKWFFWQLGLLEAAQQHHNWIHNYENEVFKARKGYIEDCIKAIEKGLPVVKIVRNPYMRAVSGYLEICGKKVFETGHWARRQRRVILESLTGHFLELDYGFSFRQYVDWLSAQADYAVDPHIRQQFMTVESKVQVEPLHLEDGPKLFHTLEQRFGLKDSSSDLDLFDSRHHHTKTNISPYPTMGFADLALPVSRNARFKIIDFDLDEMSKSDIGSKLQRYFSKDFINYGYSF